MLDRVALLSLCSLVAVNALGYTRQVTVDGFLFCQGRIVANSSVFLYERDRFDPDDLLNSTTSDQNGYFLIYGNETEVGAVQFYLLIKHHCHHGNRYSSCIVTDIYDVPSDLFNDTYSMDVVSLDIVQMKHTCDCKTNIGGKNQKKEFFRHIRIPHYERYKPFDKTELIDEAEKVEIVEEEIEKIEKKEEKKKAIGRNQKGPFVE